jgi:hypothetical protein
MISAIFALFSFYFATPLTFDHTFGIAKKKGSRYNHGQYH